MITPPAAIQSQTYVERCRHDLAILYSRIAAYQKQSRYFFTKLYTFFFGINFASYWVGIFVLFPHSLGPKHFEHYAKISIPVGVLGSLFDFFSFFLTLWVIRKALSTRSTFAYLGHLSLDLIIAFLATTWVLLVFIISGWLINQIENRSYVSDDRDQIVAVPESSIEQRDQFNLRTKLYTQRVESALKHP